MRAGFRHTRKHNRDLMGARAAFLRVARLVAHITDVPEAEILMRPPSGRQWRIDRAFARRAAFYLTVIALDIPAARLARALGRPRWSVSKAVQKAELERDDPAIDELLTRMETML